MLDKTLNKINKLRNKEIKEWTLFQIYTGKIWEK